ncbi:cytochrome b, partial [Bacillus thuringiensis]|nr:cytochrome b [Bacillus thuringiensis]
KWLKDHENKKKGNKMNGKNGKLTDDKIDELNEYVKTIKGEK